MAAQLGEKPGQLGIRRRTQGWGARRHHTGGFDPGEQFARPAIDDGHAGADLGERVAMHRGMGTRLDRTEGGLTRHRCVEPAIDRPTSRRPVTSQVGSERVDVGKENAIRRRTVADPSTRSPARSAPRLSSRSTRPGRGRQRVEIGSPRRRARRRRGGWRRRQGDRRRRPARSRHAPRPAGRGSWKWPPTPRDPACGTSQRHPRRLRGHRTWSR